MWRGKHAQAPVAVAAKPHYFGELDVVASVAALARANGGALWRSPEVCEAVERGGLVELDPDFFAQACHFVRFLGSRGWGACALTSAGGPRSLDPNSCVRRPAVTVQQPFFRLHTMSVICWWEVWTIFTGGQSASSRYSSLTGLLGMCLGTYFRSVLLP